jgi:transposase InsO family protein
MTFSKRFEEMGVKPSMGTVGDAYDNAIAESFFATLEYELIDRHSWNTKTEVRLASFTCIEFWKPRCVVLVDWVNVLQCVFIGLGVASIDNVLKRFHAMSKSEGPFHEFGAKLIE